MRRWAVVGGLKLESRMYRVFGVGEVGFVAVAGMEWRIWNLAVEAANVRREFKIVDVLGRVGRDILAIKDNGRRKWTGRIVSPRLLVYSVLCER